MLTVNVTVTVNVNVNVNVNATVNVNVDDDDDETSPRHGSSSPKRVSGQCKHNQFNLCDKLKRP